ncbi:pyridoxamine 5'-phosphate oxidase family protein [Streptomyces sp. NPDC093109]|uniref:pyridoxamine 5'-phosphate oxidase family protein n=1 Tax=Streptomyces sp. NPDC093109 TaxID=3154977 RepID=UPI003450BF40
MPPNSPKDPRTELDPRYGDPAAEPLPWPRAVELLAGAEVFWLTTVRPEGRPHVTPLLALWWDGALYFCTGAGERKARNLAHSPEVVLTTGTNTLRGGCDLVIEGTAVRVADEGRLTALAGAWEAKYGPDWHVEVREGAFTGNGGNTALVFAVFPRTAFGFAKDPYGQTRWRFS